MTDHSPECCEKPMRLVGIEDYDGVELHTFECSECRKVEAPKDGKPDMRPH
jgi:hypothetical protein